MSSDTASAVRRVLRVDSGASHTNSVSAQLADALAARFAAAGHQVLRRPATEGLPVVTGAWVEAAFAQGDPAVLALSDALVDELLAVDEVMLVAPIYNFGIPAAMKAWIDQVVRAGRTFHFTPTGPQGLVTATRAWILTASRGTPVGSALDFNTTYLRTVLEFIGLEDIRIIAADQLQFRGEQAIIDALAQIAEADI